jgi:ribosomal protein S18 acetylase RimI-like enzyme
MRRILAQAPETPEWPASLRPIPFSADIAVEAHELLMLGRQLGGGQVADFQPWMDAFDLDPECDRQLVFVIVDASGVAGVAQCWTSAFIRNLAVHPRVQGQGVGRRLLEMAFAAFRQRRESHVDLKVLESNLTARRLYERVGMEYVWRAELDPA